MPNFSEFSHLKPKRKTGFPVFSVRLQNVWGSELWGSNHGGPCFSTMGELMFKGVHVNTFSVVLH
ncbi:MAG: hypothetical protein LKG84_05890, partial [Solobacterium sp.]|nr:hypothetical protein [Solobacterium sp.]MCI1385235.1 hypothetical protein [Solobacterium sp.]MCI1433992.1 hypothetical protein [Solobacterium sp.]MCI1463273.1 hypothetical protein [Solobacterium sp.]MCI1558905.1 hypothetical protein [Solobacterium sp.]